MMEKKTLHDLLYGLIVSKPQRIRKPSRKSGRYSRFTTTQKRNNWSQGVYTTPDSDMFNIVYGGGYGSK